MAKKTSATSKTVAGKEVQANEQAKSRNTPIASSATEGAPKPAPDGAAPKAPVTQKRSMVAAQRPVTTRSSPTEKQAAAKQSPDTIAEPTRGPRQASDPLTVAPTSVSESPPASSLSKDPVGPTPASASSPIEAQAQQAPKPQPAPERGHKPAPAAPEAESEPEPEPLQPALPTTEPKAPPAATETPSQPIPAEAEAESVHIEEPVPDQHPEWHQEQSPHAYHGPSLYLVHITPEMAPVAKVGGLADVVFGLSRELAIRGNHVEIILPKYDNLRYDQIFELQVVYDDLWVPWYNGAIHCTVFFGFVHDRKCYFIEPHSQDNFFNRGNIYGFHDDVMRYAFFTRAAMEYLFKAGKHPDIIHCHDWQTALAPVFLYEIYQHMGMTHPRACLTIHNFKHQGVTGMEVLRATGLHRPDHFFDYERLRDNGNPHALNLLKGGIVYSNFTTTVSPRYAFETTDEDQGFGLEPTLHGHHMKYGGVVNGIDYDVWNPEIDHHIPVRYSSDNIDGKYDNKRALRHRLMLADNEKPIVAFIGRLDPQKGLELVRHAIFFALERGAQFVLLGSSPDAGINADFWGLKQMLNDSPDCHLEIGFDEDLAHLIYAGADMILVPSRFEPCGLTQLIALRYGTIPVVRAVGGLADTVFDKDHSHRPLHERNGYTFVDYDHAGLESALERAIACYYHHPDHFRELMKNSMRSDYSWNIPGKDYLNIYDYIRNK